VQLKLSTKVPTVVGISVTDPESATLPLNAGAPLAVQAEAFALDQLNVRR
jgi:hypothetical protein